MPELLPPSLDALFSEMFCDDTSMIRWLDTHCEHDDHRQSWRGRHYFDQGRYQFVAFEARNTSDDLFYISVDSREGVVSLFTDSVSEFLLFLDNTVWHAVEETPRRWLDSNYTVVSANGEEGFIWSGTFSREYAVQQDVVRHFKIEMDESEGTFTIHHEISGIDPIHLPYYASVKDMLTILHTRLHQLFMREHFQNNATLCGLDDLRQSLYDRYIPTNEEETSWTGTHHYTFNGMEKVMWIDVVEVVGGFLVGCTHPKGTFEPFLATSVDAFQEFLANTEWNRLAVSCD
jgi:hypothetical protein